jgi:tetratricopeptide (TPR) repeat protein
MGRRKSRTLLFGLLLSLFMFASAKSQSKLVEECQSADVNSLESSSLAAAIKICTEALATPGIPSNTTAELLMNRGVAFRNAGTLDLSLIDLNKSVELAPQSTIHLRMRAWTLRVMGRLSDALNDYDRVLKMEREFQGLLSRCNILIELGKFPVALADCQESLNSNRNPDSLFMTAFLYNKLEVPNLAIPLLHEAVGRDDAEARAFLLLSEIVAKKGERELAIKFVKNGLKMHPNDQSLIDRFAEIAK